MREPKSYPVCAGDIDLTVHEWPGDSDPILLLHATGFHSRCWNQVVEKLPEQHVYAVDLHFHGDSANAGGTVDWRLFTSDICSLIETMDFQKLVGVGHSIGGHLITRAAAAMPERFKHLVLIDPVIFSPEFYAGLESLLGDVDVHDHPVSRRKNSWRDADEMYQRFSSRPPFDSWQPEVLRDYCDYALRPTDNSELMQLACNPLNEASNYINQVGNEIILGELHRVTMPVTLLRAPPAETPPGGFESSPTWSGLARALPRCHEVYLPHLNHFIPMQDPALVAQHIRTALAG